MDHPFVRPADTSVADQVRPPAFMAGAPGSAATRQHELSGKLHLTRLALGCPTLKELAARFSHVNPHTAFTAQSAYKWLRGRAAPRASSVYADWSRVLQERLSPPFIAAASFDEFEQALRRDYALPEAAVGELRAALPLVRARRNSTIREVEEQRVPVVDDAPSVAPARARRPALLEGCFLAVRPDWSRPAGQAVDPDRLAFGAIRIAVAPEGGLVMDYAGSVLGRRVLSSGWMTADGRAAQAALRCPYTGRLQFLSLHAPTFPGNVCIGLLCGTALDDPQARPVAVRVVLLRSQALGWEELCTLAGTEAVTSDALARRVGTLGYGDASEDATLTRLLAGYLVPSGSPAAFEVGNGELAALSDAVDRLAV